MANSSVEAEDAAGDDRAVEAGVLAERFIEQRGEILAFEMVLHWAAGGAVRATVADRAMCGLCSVTVRPDEMPGDGR